MAADRTRVLVVTATGWVYAPEYLMGVIADDRFDIVGIVSVPPHAGSDDRLTYALDWVEAFGVRGTLEHAFRTASFSLRDRLARFTGYGQLRSAETLAKRHDIPHRTVSSVNAPALLALAEEQNPDVLVSVAAPDRFESATLAIADLAINVHASLLPDHRGVMPAFWAMRAGDRETGVTVHHMTETLDAGAIIARKRVPIKAEDSLHALNERLANVGSDVLREALVDLREGTDTATPVDPEAGSYHSLPERDDVRAFRQAGYSLY